MVCNIVISVALMLIPISSGARDIREMLADVAGKAKTGCVTLKYSFSTSGDVEIHDEGTVEAQDDLWHLKGDEFEIFTDSSATWIIDNGAREVIVEPAWSYADLEKFYESVVEKGSVMDIDILSESVSDKKPVSYFTPSFGQGWMVTDLR